MLIQQSLTYTLKLDVNQAEDADAELKLLMTMDSYARACGLVSDFAREFGEENAVRLSNILYYRIRKEFFLPAQIASSIFRTVAANIKTLRTVEKQTGKASASIQKTGITGSTTILCP